MVLQSDICTLSGGKGTIFGRSLKKYIYLSVEFHFGGETAWLGAPDVALRGVWTVSYSSGLECILPISSSYFLLEFSTNAYL